ncbi:Piso0_001581 [Millerozyma farinosa CBS 7064]|uniref:Piso0_001581 protein n=1 Tax=Pichia sorbitophila (strain ATCC MYA-4447 / BCRC 22081 / CBS 7064 / NBRC 10061 / NRRL Y-12695) TaxID=559304 RepID=G8YL65_PICSO|nr:Piso0_001581 [Millerozyma farinosa CBS 7064]
MEEMDIDDYSRDRSRSPVRYRSRSPSQRRGTDEGHDKKEKNERRGYGNSRGRYATDRRSDSNRRGYKRGGYRGRDFVARRDFNYSRNPDEYRSKSERNYDNSIFIGNIPFSCTSKDIQELFKDDFQLIKADIVTSRGRSRGMATVEFSNKEDVAKAISKFDHYEFLGREIFVRQDYPPPSDKRKDDSPREDSFSKGYNERNSRSAVSTRDQPPVPKPGTEIFVGNLPFSINWQALKDLMREAGEVVRADVRTDNWGKSRGFGTVVFNTEEEAAKAVEYFQGYEIEGRRLDTRPGRKSNYADDENEAQQALPSNTDFTDNVVGEGDRSNTIFASNLPWATNEDDLYELFETIGKVSRAELQLNEKGKPSGNAVIQFEQEENADIAIANLDNYNYGGRDLKITYAKKL